MATIAKIRCLSCEGKFDFYFNVRKTDAIQCPYCYTYMEERSAMKVLDVMGAFSDMNRDLRKYADQRKEPLFQFNLHERGN